MRTPSASIRRRGPATSQAMRWPRARGGAPSTRASFRCPATLKPCSRFTSRCSRWRWSMSEPLQPARIDFTDAAAPRAIDYGDVYHPRAGAFAQARHVFLAGNGLPRRWAGRAHFVILETGFGLGHNFLATWAAW